VLFDKEETTLIQFPCGRTGAYTVPGFVSSIKQSAFAHCSGLSSVTIPASVESIGTQAFLMCSHLEFLSYLGESDPGEGNVFVGSDKLRVICVPLNYSSSEFCKEPNFCKKESCDDLFDMDGRCYMITCENNEWGFKQRDNATKWEEQSNQCYEYQCDNESGPLSWCMCNSSVDLNRTCVNGKCIDGKKYRSKQWSVEIEIDGTVKALDINLTQLIVDIVNVSALAKGNFTVGIMNDYNGAATSILLFVNNEEIAENLSQSIDGISKEECEYGVLCYAVRTFINGKKNEVPTEISVSGCQQGFVSMMCLVLLLIFTIGGFLPTAV